MNGLRKYWWVALTSARSNLAYLGDIVGRVLFLAVLLYIFLQLWKATYGQTGAVQLGGLTLSQMLWYLTITEAITLSAPKVAQLVDEDVRTGALSMQLVRPFSYAWYRLASSVGERVVRFAINLAVGAAITVMLVGPSAPNAGGLMLFALSLPLAFLLDFLGNFWIGLGAFWLEDTSGLLLIYSRGTMIIGGVLIPLELYPTCVQPLLKLLPFSNIAYGPARLFVDPGMIDLLQVLGRQLFGAALLGLGVLITYRLALRRVFVNGG